MKTSLDETVLMCNLKSDTNIEDFKNLLNSIGIKFDIKKVEPFKDLHNRMTEGWTEIVFIKNFDYIEGPLDVGFKRSGTQKSISCRVWTKFNINNLIFQQNISPSGSSVFMSLFPMYEIFEPFLFSANWKVIKRKQNENATYSTQQGVPVFREEENKILLQNIEKTLLIICEPKTVNIRHNAELEGILSWSFK